MRVRGESTKRTSGDRPPTAASSACQRRHAGSATLPATSSGSPRLTPSGLVLFCGMGSGVSSVGDGIGVGGEDLALVIVPIEPPHTDTLSRNARNPRKHRRIRPVRYPLGIVIASGYERCPTRRPRRPHAARTSTHARRPHRPGRRAAARHRHRRRRGRWDVGRHAPAPTRRGPRDHRARTKRRRLIRQLRAALPRVGRDRRSRRPRPADARAPRGAIPHRRTACGTRWCRSIGQRRPCWFAT